MKTNQQVAIEVIAGKWGNGSERRTALWNAGYDPDAVQSIVNALMSGGEAEADTGEYLTVEVDMEKYAGINLKLKTGGATHDP